MDKFEIGIRDALSHERIDLSLYRKDAAIQARAKVIQEARIKEAIEYSKKYLGTGYDEHIDDLSESFYDEIRDDFHNCGGNPVGRIPDLLGLAALLEEDYLEDIIEEFVDTFKWIGE